jgi:hypothetical protein
MRTTTAQPTAFDRPQQIALIVGVVGLLISVVGAFIDREQFFQSYLLGYLYWLGFALGGLALILIQHLAGGIWGALVRRPLEAAMMTLPLLALLFIPIILGMGDLYIWTRPEEAIIAAYSEPEKGRLIAEFVEYKRAYLNTPFFIIRAVIYFAIWFGLAYILNRWSEEQDRTADPRLVGRFKGLGGVGILVFVLVMTFAAIDWGMSIEPEFFSAIYGLIFIVGQGLTAFTFSVLLISFLMHRPPYLGVVTPNRLHDLGKFIFAFTILWTYVNLSQFIIIWSGNLPEEAPWYIHRGEGGWNVLSVLLVVFHFVVPFFILLSRQVKRNIRQLSVIAIAILFMQFVNMFWLLMPSFHPEGFTISVFNLTAPIGIGGIWLAAFFWLLKRKSLLPLHDHRLELAGVHVEDTPPIAGGATARS